MNQKSFASLGYDSKKKTTRREKFLGEMEEVIPWKRLEELIERHYPKAGQGRRPMELSTMLRIHFLQQWYSLSDPAAEEALYDMESMRRFAGVELGSDPIPDETTILNFRRLLEREQLTGRLFEEVRDFLEEKKLLLRGGTILDATLISAPSSTKNPANRRDPEMSSTRKGNQWHFGLKAHIGVDAHSGLIHTVGTTTASVPDVRVATNLIREDDQAVFGDKGYVHETLKKAARSARVYWAVMEKRKPGKALSSSQKKRNRKHAKIRAKVEHPFRVIKCQFGYRKTRYRGIVKNGHQINILMMLANLYRARRSLLIATG